MQPDKTAAIILNGEKDALPIDGDFIICADAGYLNRGKRIPDVLIGDFDSLKIIPEGIKIIRHEPEKNMTDGELALRYANESGFKKAIFYSALGGREDHLLGNFALLALAKKLGTDAEIKGSGVRIFYSEGRAEIEGKIGDTVSIIPFGGPAVVRSSRRLFYPLENLTLEPVSSRGISNLLTAEKAEVEIDGGGALIFIYHT
jgi:thiamine pyrophosphokinase